MNSILCLVIVAASIRVDPVAGDGSTDEAAAVEFMVKLNNEYSEKMGILGEEQWIYATDITEEHQSQYIKALEEFQKFTKEKHKDIEKYQFNSFKNESLKRQFKKLAFLGLSALDEEDSALYNQVTTNMETIYSEATVTIDGEKVRLDPNLTQIMASKNSTWEQLTEAWVGWRNATGPKMREDYIKYYNLGNKAAKLNKLDTFDDIWLFPWETDNLKEEVAEIWKEVNEKLYKKLHAFVRWKLTNVYGDKMPKDRTIPAHLLGNMWAQSWPRILHLPGVDPFPNVATPDITEKLENDPLEYHVNWIFNKSEEFFMKLNKDLKMTDTFRFKSVFERKKGVNMTCHASAWDFYQQNCSNNCDFRIKMCTTMTHEDFVTVHHEMGHIVYYMLYKDQPAVFRDGANPGFHEAIGDLIALSVATPKHLEKLGLYVIDPNTKNDLKLKFLLKMALEKVAFLPFGYITDLWRWDLFSGQVSSKQMNKHWWELRLKYQGISPPVIRSENDFDPGAKYHIPASVEYIRYFVAHILQFQFHKVLCETKYKNNPKPLYECDIGDENDGDVSKAGQLLSNMLAKGSSEEWPHQLGNFTAKSSKPTNKIDPTALFEYFEPLIEFLNRTIEENKIEVGWEVNIDSYYSKSNKLKTSLVIIIAAFLIKFLI